MQAKDIMTTRVVTVPPDESISQVAAILVERNISAVPVVDADGTLRGIVSEGDLLHRAEIGTDRPAGSWWLRMFRDPGKAAEEYTRTHGKCARDVMTTAVVAVDEEATLSQIAETLERNHVKRVPVLRQGKVVGIVSRANIVREIAAAPAAALGVDSDDRTIRSAVEKRLAEQSWASAGSTTVTVREGVVELWGTVGASEEIPATRILTQEIDGVKEVKDHRAKRPLVPSGGL